MIVRALLALVLVATPAVAQNLSPQEAVRRMKVADGFEVTLVASEPAVRQPLSITFDGRGRIWVIQYLQYPTPAGLKAVKTDEYLRTVYDRVPEPPPKGPRGADKITILEDKDGDGTYETAKDFVSGLNLASGLCLGYGGAFIAQPPYLLFYADRNGDDVPDGDPEVLLTGFGMDDSHSVANSLQWGPDGWLYGAAGSTSTSKIRGIEFQQGIWRYHPITKEFELFSEGGGNTWGLDFDRHGNAIAGTNFGGSAMLHQVQGAYYLKGFSKHGPLHNPNTYGYFDHVPYTGFKGGHVTCGGTIYQGGAFPESFNDQYIACSVLSNAVYWHVVEPKGSSFVNRFGGELLTTDDQWFRPIDTLIGPDGALYVVDWYDARANHVDPRDNWDKTNGRLYRIASKDAPKLPRPDLTKMSGVELVDVLQHPNVWYRGEARRLLAERRDPSVFPPLRAALNNATNAEPLWALYVSGGFDETLALDCLKHPNEDVRAWAIRFQGDSRKVGPTFCSALLGLATNDPSPRVRSQMACTAKRLPAEASLKIIAALARRKEDRDDPQIPMLLWWALEDKAVSARDQVLALFSLPDTWNSPITTTTILERLARRYMTEGDADACATLLRKAPSPEVQTFLVRGMDKALEGRRLEQVPAALRELLDALRQSRPNDTDLLSLAIRLGDERAYADALERLSKKDLRESEASVLIQLLGQIARPDALPVLIGSLRSSGTPVQIAAVTALQSYKDPGVADALLQALPDLKPGPLRTRALSLLTARPDASLQLLRVVDAGLLKPADVPLAEVQKLAVYEDPELKRLIEKHWGKVGAATPGEKRAQISSIRNILANGKGDRARGKAIFTKTCAVCHTLWNEGNKIGPELTAADRKNLDLLAMNIVDPSAMIRPEYAAHQILTKDGQVLTGLLVEQSAQAVTILDANNQRTVLGRNRIEVLKPSQLSLMPEKLLDPLTDPEIRDFFAYLQGDGPVEVAFPEQSPPLKVCLISGSLEYESDASLAALQEHLEKNYNVQCSRAFRKTDEDVPGLENLDTCDVAVIFTRRLKITGEALDRVKKYCDAGKPVVGIRTASHAFQNWLELDKEVLGGSYTNHYEKGPEIVVERTEKGKTHPILDGVGSLNSPASLYKNQSNAEDTETLLMGSAGGHTEPLAWTRVHKGGRVFYTSLGDQTDFKNDAYVRMIVNALFWTAKRAPEKKTAKSDGVKAPGGGNALPGTKPLEMNGDLGAEMVAGIDRFLLREIDASVQKRAAHWHRDLRSKDLYESSVAPNRERLRQILGIVDQRTTDGVPEFPVPATQPGMGFATASSDNFQARVIRWPVFRGVEGEGLLLIPKVADGPLAIVLPDADQTPEMQAGITPGLPEDQQIARRLAEHGCWVLVPTLIDRNDTCSVSFVDRATNQPHREFVYRPAFEMGRTLIGYEIQKVLAFVDYLDRQGRKPSFKVGVFGVGEGGLLALYAGAVDARFDATWVGGYFESRQKAWQEPIYRNVFGLLREFGDAELASLIAPRTLIAAAGPALEIKGPPLPRSGRGGAAPGFWSTPDVAATHREVERSLPFTKGLSLAPLVDAFDLGAPGKNLPPLRKESDAPDALKRLKRQMTQLLEDTQVLLRKSESIRDAAFWSKLDLRSVATFEASSAPFREAFVDTVIGKFDAPLLPPNARSRQVYDEPKYSGYEVMLDVFQDVFAYGILLLPKDLRPGEKRPVVVCQHGLEGRPQHVANPQNVVSDPGSVAVYGQFACRLAERGFVVFAPQNPYLGKDNFRTLQRKANLLGGHLFSIIIPQHQVITDWLASQPFVDPSRIAFYGISYGGKTAMRVPAAVRRYCLSICSADFNEWIWKNASLDSPYSYVTTNEYEIFEWNLANTFNYAEMAALIAPRPFMVERGHADGVAPDERVAYEYAKVKRLYDKLKIGDRTEIEVFDGPHKINGVGTFEFLHKHLQWPKNP